MTQTCAKPTSAVRNATWPPRGERNSNSSMRVALAAERELRRAHVDPVLADDRLEVAALPSCCITTSRRARRPRTRARARGSRRSGRCGETVSSHHWIVKPPSTTIVWPVIQADASESRNATGPAMSSGSPMRRSGWRSAIAGASSSKLSRPTVGHRREHEPRRHGVDADAVGPDVDGERAHERVDAALGGAVARIARRADARELARDQHQRSAAPERAERGARDALRHGQVGRAGCRRSPRRSSCADPGRGSRCPPRARRRRGRRAARRLGHAGRGRAGIAQVAGVAPHAVELLERLGAAPGREHARALGRRSAARSRDRCRRTPR